MANKVDIGGIADAIASELSGYTKEVAEGVKAVVDETAEELLQNTRADAPSRYGKYKKAMAIKKRHESDYEKRVTWYVKPPHYRLSHVLEKGHAKRGGGRVRAYPHIEKNEAKAKEKFEKRVKEVTQNAGKRKY